jgi:hypothetical protein
MKSVTVAVPDSVSNVVSRTFVRSTYAWSVSNVPVGVMANRPPRSGSRRRAKTLGESTYGRQHQSIEPSRFTSAHVSRFPMTPYSRRGVNASSIFLTGDADTESNPALHAVRPGRVGPCRAVVAVPIPDEFGLRRRTTRRVRVTSRAASSNRSRRR